MSIQNGNTITSSSARSGSSIEPAKKEAIVCPIRQITFRGKKKSCLNSRASSSRSPHSKATWAKCFKPLLFHRFSNDSTDNYNITIHLNVV